MTTVNWGATTLLSSPYIALLRCNAPCRVDLTTHKAFDNIRLLRYKRIINSPLPVSILFCEPALRVESL
jgi:hypothetical protein